VDIVRCTLVISGTIIKFLPTYLITNLISTGNIPLTQKLKSSVVTRSTMTTMKIVLTTMTVMLINMRPIKTWVLMTRMLKQNPIGPANLRFYLIRSGYVSDPEWCVKSAALYVSLLRPGAVENPASLDARVKMVANYIADLLTIKTCVLNSDAIIILVLCFLLPTYICSSRNNQKLPYC